MIIYPNPYPNITIACYPAGSGGNFLLNCLSLSDQSLLRHANLAAPQLIKRFSSEDKIFYLIEKLKECIDKNEWNDLGLGCRQFYGVEAESYMAQYHDIIAYRMNPVVSEAMLQGYHLFLGGQTTVMMRNYLSFWPNARIIFFKNYREFAQQRPHCNPLPDIDQIFDRIHPKAVASMQEELGDRTREFDVSVCYDKFENFWEEYLLITKWIGISPAPQKDIQEYFKLWKTSLSQCELS